jgi:hypothetical protein
MQIKNRKGTSAWMLSFQNYLKAMSDHRHRHQLPEQIAQLKQLRSKAQPKATAMASASKSRSASTADEDWEKVTPNKSGHKNKREIEEPKGNTQTKMNMEPNKERVEMIQTQIALLQRELAREMQVPEDQ